MMCLAMKQTLLLNSTYEPLGVLSWQKAVSLWVADKVEIVEEYDDFDLKSVSFTMKCPAVVRLLKYVKRTKKKVKFSRMNVFRRDEHSCAYCGDEPGIKGLTFDHVVPRSQGGKTNWDNIVTACYACNSKKRNRTPQEAGMALLRKPYRPDVENEYQLILNIPKTPDAWRNFLYWHQSLEQD